MKTPEEIKKGLDCCQTIVRCAVCPYHDIGDIVAECTAQLSENALAYIQQLESGNESKQKRIEELESRLAQVEKENKALLHDMAKYTMCGACKHFANREQCPQHDECVYGEIGHFEWRGVCAENTEEG